VGGDGKQIARAKDRATREGVAERVLFVGPQADLSLYLWAADMFVLPSVYEANGLVYLEALASGLPVVATRVGIAREVVKDDVNGFLVDLDPQQVGDRLQHLASVDLRTWRERARASVQDFSWRAVAERYLSLIALIDAQRSG
jgi:UDP-glucose:(heptosyl)LPS alpha-1,3-glucosyltransferase